MSTPCRTEGRLPGKRWDTPGAGLPGLLPWLLLGMGAFSNLFQGTTPNPWVGGAGLLVFNSLYVFLAFSAHPRGRYPAGATRVALALLAAVTCALAAGYGGSWLLLFPLLGLATGTVLHGRHLWVTAAAVTVVAGGVAVAHDGWGGLSVLYATAMSTTVTATLVRLTRTVRERESDYLGSYFLAVLADTTRLHVQPNAIPGEDGQDDLYEHEYTDVTVLLLITSPVAAGPQCHVA